MSMFTVTQAYCKQCQRETRHIKLPSKGYLVCDDCGYCEQLPTSVRSHTEAPSRPDGPTHPNNDPIHE